MASPYPVRLLLGVGIAAFAVALVALMPIRFLAGALPAAVPVSGPTGTLWQGQVTLALPRGGHTVSWDLQAGQLLLLGVVLDWSAQADGLDVRGRVSLRPWRRTLRIEHGDISARYLRRVLPGLPLDTDQPVLLRTIEVATAPGGRVTHADGRLAWGPGTLTVRGKGEPRQVPALRGLVSSTEDGKLLVSIDGESAPGDVLATVDADFVGGELHAAVLQRAAALAGIPANERAAPGDVLAELRQPLQR